MRSACRAAPCIAAWRNSGSEPMASVAARAAARPARPFERRIAWFTVALALPALAFGAALLWSLDLMMVLRVCLFAVLALLVGGIGVLLYESITQPLRGLANVVEAYRAGDYTV